VKKQIGNASSLFDRVVNISNRGYNRAVRKAKIIVEANYAHRPLIQKMGSDKNFFEEISEY